MFYQDYIRRYIDLWNTYPTIKERKYQLRMLLEKKTRNTIPHTIKKSDLIEQLATYDHNENNRPYAKYQPLMQNRSLDLFDKPTIGVTRVRHLEQNITDPLWVKLVDHCQCPQIADNILCKYVECESQRALYINLFELYSGKQISRNTFQFKHIMKHIKRILHMQYNHILDNHDFLSLMPQFCDIKHHIKKIVKSKYKDRSCSSLFPYQQKTVSWMRHVEKQVEHRRYIQYETKLDYIYRWQDSNMYYNTRNDTLTIGYSHLQALMAFRGGMIATEDGLGKTRICAQLIMENPRKFNDVYGTLVVCSPHMIDFWVKELELSGNPIIKTLAIKNVSKLKSMKMMISEAEVVVVPPSVACRMMDTTWFRVIFDDAHRIPEVRYPNSVFRWILCDTPKYQLTYGNNHLKFLKHIFNLLQIETQNPRRNLDSFLLRKVHNINNHLSIPHTILDTNLLQSFYDNLYYRDTKANLNKYIPMIEQKTATVEWSQEEIQYYRDLCLEKKYTHTEILTRVDLCKRNKNLINKTSKYCNAGNLEHMVSEHTHIVNDFFFSKLLIMDEQIAENPSNIYLHRLKDKLERDIATFNQLNTFRTEEAERIKTKFTTRQVCDICIDTYAEPVIILNCMHYYCKNCIYQIAQHSENNRMQCPKCKITFKDCDKVIYNINGPNVIENPDFCTKYGSKIGVLLKLLEQYDSAIIYTQKYEIKCYLLEIFEELNISEHNIWTLNHDSGLCVDASAVIIFDFDEDITQLREIMNKDVLDRIQHVGSEGVIDFIVMRDPKMS